VTIDLDAILKANPHIDRERVEERAARVGKKELVNLGRQGVAGPYGGRRLSQDDAPRPLDLKLSECRSRYGTM